MKTFPATFIVIWWSVVIGAMLMNIFFAVHDFLVEPINWLQVGSIMLIGIFTGLLGTMVYRYLHSRRPPPPTS